MIFLSSYFFQPIEFKQIEHEKRFKLVLKCLFILITVYVGSFFLLAQIIEPGALFGRVYFLTGDLFEQEESIAALTEVFILFSHGITALAMVTAEICARIMRPASTIIQPVCSAGFVVNSIPFFTLNLSIVLIIVVQLVTGVFLDFVLPFWLIISGLITTILVTNKGATKHVLSRLRQQIDSFTIGRNNTFDPGEPVHPVVDPDEPVHPVVTDEPVHPVVDPGEPVHPVVNRDEVVHPVVTDEPVHLVVDPDELVYSLVDVAPVPLGDTPTLPTRATLCPVSE